MLLLWRSTADPSSMHTWQMNRTRPRGLLLLRGYIARRPRRTDNGAVSTSLSHHRRTSSSSAARTSSANNASGRNTTAAATAHHHSRRMLVSRRRHPHDVLTARRSPPLFHLGGMRSVMTHVGHAAVTIAAAGIITHEILLSSRRRHHDIGAQASPVIIVGRWRWRLHGRRLSARYRFTLVSLLEYSHGLGHFDGTAVPTGAIDRTIVSPPIVPSSSARGGSPCITTPSGFASSRLTARTTIVIIHHHGLIFVVLTLASPRSTVRTLLLLLLLMWMLPLLIIPSR